MNTDPPASGVRRPVEQAHRGGACTKPQASVEDAGVRPHPLPHRPQHRATPIVPLNVLNGGSRPRHRSSEFVAYMSAKGQKANFGKGPERVGFASNTGISRCAPHFTGLRKGPAHASADGSGAGFMLCRARFLGPLVGYRIRSRRLSISGLQRCNVGGDVEQVCRLKRRHDGRHQLSPRPKPLSILHVI
jgi:hypothetical protein